MNDGLSEYNTTKSPRYTPAVAAIKVRCKKIGCGYVGYAARRGKCEPIPFINWISSYYCCAVCGCSKIEAVIPTVVSDPVKQESLRLLYGQFNNEITRYRDYEWKIVLWGLGLSWGIFIASKLYVNFWFLDVVMIAIILLGTLLLGTHLLFVHGELTTNRNWRENTRRLLGIYLEEGPFLPEWQSGIYGFKSGRDHFVIHFLLFMLLAAIGSSYLISWKYPVPRFIETAPKVVAYIWSYWPMLPISLIVLTALRYIWVAMTERTQKKQLPGPNSNQSLGNG